MEKNKEEQILKLTYIQASHDPIREKLIEEWDKNRRIKPNFISNNT